MYGKAVGLFTRCQQVTMISGSPGRAHEGATRVQYRDTECQQEAVRDMRLRARENGGEGGARTLRVARGWKELTMEKLAR